MTQILVTVGTDGMKDWVRTPDGQKFALGSISVLSFVSKLARNSRAAKNTLDDFLKTGEAVLKVNDDHMWSILAPRRARWASDGSFMFQDQRQAHLPPRTGMTTLDDILTKTETVMAYCTKQASAGNPIDPQAFKDLEISAQKLAASLDSTYDENMRLAKAILDESTQTVVTINKLASAGKRFNRTAALKDVASVTHKVAGICEKTALTEEWVVGDLQKLAAESTRIHQLFHSK